MKPQRTPCPFAKEVVPDTELLMHVCDLDGDVVCHTPYSYPHCIYFQEFTKNDGGFRCPNCRGKIPTFPSPSNFVNCPKCGTVLYQPVMVK